MTAPPLSAGLVNFQSVRGELRHAPLTRRQYYALRRAIRMHPTIARLAIRACDYADSPMWAAREESYRQAANLVALKSRLPVARETPMAALLKFQSARRDAVLIRVHERKHAAARAARNALVREPGESLPAYVARKCGFVEVRGAA